MIYKNKGQPVTVTINNNKHYSTVTKIKKLTNYVVITELEIKTGNVIFNRETGESIPKSNLTIQADTRCKACFSWELDDQRVKWKRIDRYERKRVTKHGHQCKSCGYLNTE